MLFFGLQRFLNQQVFCQMLSHGVPIRTRRKINDGFTVIELLVTLAIISLLASLSAPRFSQKYDNDRIRESIKTVSSWIDDQRKKTIQSSSSCLLEFSSAKHAISFGSNGRCEASKETLELKNMIIDGSDLQMAIKATLVESDGSSTIVKTNEADLYFSPRGTVQIDDDYNDITIEIGLKSSSARPGCIKMIEPLGLIRIARQNSDQKCDFTNPY